MTADERKSETQEKCFACCYPNEEICHGPAFGCIADDYTALSNAAVQARISALEAELTAANEQIKRVREETIKECEKIRKDLLIESQHHHDRAFYQTER